MWGVQLVKLAAGILPVVFLSELAGGLNAACAGVRHAAALRPSPML